MGDQRTCTIQFFGEVEMMEKEIWPDGDAPENWTVADVVAVLQKCGRREVLREWFIDRSIRFAVFTPGRMDTTEVKF